MENYAHIIMLALGAVGIAAAAVLEITAFMQVGGDKKKKDTALFLSAANFIYALLAFMMLTNNGGYNDMTIPCLVLGAATFLSSLAQGIIFHRGFLNGALSEAALYSRCILYCAFAEIPSVAALVYFFLALN